MGLMSGCCRMMCAMIIGMWIWIFLLTGAQKTYMRFVRPRAFGYDYYEALEADAARKDGGCASAHKM